MVEGRCSREAFTLRTVLEGAGNWAVLWDAGSCEECGIHSINTNSILPATNIGKETMLLCEIWRRACNTETLAKFALTNRGCVTAEKKFGNCQRSNGVCTLPAGLEVIK